MQISEPLSLCSFLLFSIVPSKYQPHLSLPDLQHVLASLFKSLLCVIVLKVLSSRKLGRIIGSSPLYFFLQDHYPALPIVRCLEGKKLFQIFYLFLYLFTIGEQVLYQILLWPEAKVLDAFYMSSHLTSTNSARCQSSLFYRLGFFRLTSVPKVRQLVSIKEGEHILVLWLMMFSEKA